MGGSYVPMFEMFPLMLAFAMQEAPPQPPVQPPVPPIPAPPAFSSPFEASDLNRLALTPNLDGVMDQEEWQPLWSDAGSSASLQWEPGVLYLAAKVPAGAEGVFSLDLNGDGWLVGSDNFEVRLGMEGGQAVGAMRRLVVGRDGPQVSAFTPLPGLLTVIGSASPDGGTFYEAKLLGIGLAGFASGNKLGARFDALAPMTADAPPYIPRPMPLLSLEMDSGKGLPSGLQWNSEFKARSVAAGESIKIRLNFVSAQAAKPDKVAFRTQGFGSSFASQSKPFPAFDTKGRAFVDYETSVPLDARTGYRILQTTLDNPDGTQSTLQTSYMVAPLVLFDPNFPVIKMKSENQIVRGSVTIRSQSNKRLDGLFTLSLPEGWAISKGTDKRFTIYFARGARRIPLELIAPAGAQGLVPFVFRAQIGEKTIEQRLLIPIEQG